LLNPVLIIVGLVSVQWGIGLWLHYTRLGSRRRWTTPWFVLSGAMTMAYVGWTSRAWATSPLWAYPIIGGWAGWGLGASFAFWSRMGDRDQARLKQAERKQRYRPKLFDM
jgi:hypothetical protein